MVIMNCEEFFGGDVLIFSSTETQTQSVLFQEIGTLYSSFFW